LLRISSHGAWPELVTSKADKTQMILMLAINGECTICETMGFIGSTGHSIIGTSQEEMRKLKVYVTTVQHGNSSK